MQQVYLKKKILIGLTGLATVGILGFSIYTSQHMTKDHDEEGKENPVTEEVQPNEEPKNDEPVYMNPLDGVEDPKLSEAKKEMNQNNITMTLTEVRSLYREFKFEEGMDLLNNLSESNKFTGDAEILQKLQSDANLLLNITGHTHDDSQEVDGLALINGMKSFKDPETLFLATLYLESDVRPYVVLFGGSLNPIVQEGAFPNIMEQTTVDITHEVSVMYPETVVQHKIRFGLEGYVLDAYILEDKDGQLTFYTIEDPYKKASYYTMEQWKKINENIRNGKPSMEGVLEMHSDGMNVIGKEKETLPEETMTEEIKEDKND